MLQPSLLWYTCFYLWPWNSWVGTYFLSLVLLEECGIGVAGGCSPPPLGQSLPGGPRHETPRCCFLHANSQNLFRRERWVSRFAWCKAGLVPAWCPAWFQPLNFSNNWEDRVRATSWVLEMSSSSLAALRRQIAWPRLRRRVWRLWTECLQASTMRRGDGTGKYQEHRLHNNCRWGRRLTITSSPIFLRNTLCSISSASCWLRTTTIKSQRQEEPNDTSGTLITLGTSSLPALNHHLFSVFSLLVSRTEGAWTVNLVHILMPHHLFWQVLSPFQALHESTTLHSLGGGQELCLTECSCWLRKAPAYLDFHGMVFRAA